MDASRRTLLASTRPGAAGGIRARASGRCYELRIASIQLTFIHHRSSLLTAVSILAGATSFAFPNLFPEGSSYNVTAVAKPAGVICTVTNGCSMARWHRLAVPRTC